jgi:transketolase
MRVYGSARPGPCGAGRARLSPFEVAPRRVAAADAFCQAWAEFARRHQDTGDDITRLLSEAGQQLRVDSVRCTAAAASGHPTSSMSAADLMAVLLARHLRYDFACPRAPGNDHLIFSKGHASPLCYAMLKMTGAITDEELLSYRQAGSRLEGHPTPRLPWIDVATGSLGQGLPIGVSLAIAGRDLDQLPYRVWVLCGDSELWVPGCGDTR